MFNNIRSEIQITRQHFIDVADVSNTITMTTKSYSLPGHQRLIKCCPYLPFRPISSEQTTSGKSKHIQAKDTKVESNWIENQE